MSRTQLTLGGVLLLLAWLAGALAFAYASVARAIRREVPTA